MMRVGRSARNSLVRRAAALLATPASDTEICRRIDV